MIIFPQAGCYEQHRKDGYYTMVVSGAFEPLLNSVMKGIHFDSIIGTSISFDNKKGRHLPLEYIHVSRKKEVIHEKLANMEVDWENSFAYGDSYSDLSVLELVGNPVAVKPEPRLIQVANKRKWEVIM
ncbi:HAD family hydrolase [Cytobacillus oceanisediminis]|nr:HAD-IB family phosphatase [Cytobacillus oceanisediminis]